MLINLSNHPSSSWSARQLNAAQQAYETINDWAFPHIDPSWTNQEVQELAQQYAGDVAKIAPRPQAVHLMGEMTFCCTLVQLLQAEGIRCIASTTRRQVQEKAPGHKEVLFEFVQFRDYPLLQALHH